MNAIRKLVSAAIFDPGLTEGYKGDRTLTEWQTDAVMRIVAAVLRNAAHLITLMSEQPTARRTLIYTNYRGETSARELCLDRLWWGSTEWHPESQLLIKAWDYGKSAYRDFAVCDFCFDDAGIQPLAVSTEAPKSIVETRIGRLIEKAKELGFTDDMAREHRKSWVIGEMMLASPWLTYEECERRYQQAVGGR